MEQPPKVARTLVFRLEVLRRVRWKAVRQARREVDVAKSLLPKAKVLEQAQ